MTEVPGDVRVSVARTPFPQLHTLNDALLLDSSDVVVSARIASLVDERDPLAVLALAFTLRAVREGSTALDLADVADLTPHVVPDDGTDEEPPTVASVVDLPAPGAWLEVVERSRLCTTGALRVDLELVYLDRFHADEVLIARHLDDRRRAAADVVPADVVDAVVAGAGLKEMQELAVRTAAERSTTVLTGGPGMGKTFTIAYILKVLLSHRSDLRIALAAPTGKAASRMKESLTELDLFAPIPQATTMHRLLGSVPGTGVRFRHNRHNPLPHDVVVIDEASMVSLGMMARLMEALSPTTRLVLVGDADQLASVEAGSVLADLVTGLADDGSVVRLVDEVRMLTADGATSGRSALAKAFRSEDPDEVLAVLDAGHDDIRLVETDDPDLDDLPDAAEHARALREVAARGDIAAALDLLGDFRLLCAHRTGRRGVRRWNDAVERALAEHFPEVSHQKMYVGRPLLVTRNDYGVGVLNGDTGVIMRSDDGSPRAVIVTDAGPEEFSPWRLAEVETMHAMTVHKAQGSQAAHVAVVLPELRSRLLTRQLLYTAVTRPKERLTIVGTREEIRTAVLTPAQRSSGLAKRLAGSPAPGPGQIGQASAE